MCSLPIFPPNSLRARLQYEPHELRFGTSGRRGDVVDLTQLEVYLNALAEIQFLLALAPREGGIERGDVFYYAYDLRPSSSTFVKEEKGRGEIAQAVEQAIRDAGLNPVNLGRIPTPALTYYAISQAKGSIMITGSHIPFERNGYKVNTSIGELLKPHEAPVNRQVERVREQLYLQRLEDSIFNEQGNLKQGHRDLLPETDSARNAYLQRYSHFFTGHRLKGKRILVYQHSAVGRDLLVEILEKFGAEVIPAGRSNTFVPIDTENVDDAILAQIQKLVDETSAKWGPFEAVVSTDGDSDRPLILGLESIRDKTSSQRVRFFGGDLVGMVVAEYLKAEALVVPITCNDGVDRGILKDLLEPKTRIGSPHVIAAMEKARQKGKRRVVGWEANGGFLTGTELENEGRVLRALPTRDAVLPILCVLFASVEKSIPLPALFDALPKRYSKAALLKKMPRSISQQIIDHFSPSLSVVEASFKFETIRYQSVEGELPAIREEESLHIRNISRELSVFFPSQLGFGLIERINWTDGIRIYFSNGDIAHVRPSGNADELRIYAVADSAERTNEIVRLGVAEPDGILRRLAEAVSS
jgi:phosphomannomutase